MSCGQYCLSSQLFFHDFLLRAGYTDTRKAQTAKLMGPNGESRRRGACPRLRFVKRRQQQTIMKNG